ncbi:MAG: ABC transporter substrate-binding protein [Haloarculaceae archaeon]
MVQLSETPAVRRRAVLGTLAAGATAGTGGCVRRVRTIVGWQSTKQVSLQIKAPPTDADPYALRIARAMEGWFRAAGIDASIVPVDEGELHRQVLLNDEFDLFVARGEDRFRDPDALYSLLHSKFAEGPGWQNPFGYTNLEADELLESQRRTGGERRREAIAELQRTIARTHPFTVVAFPDDIRATRDAHFTNWRAADLRSPMGYLTLDRASGNADGPGGGDGDGDRERREGTLRTTTTDMRATENLNPLSVEYRRTGVLTGLLYDSLGIGTETGTPPTPWLAETWEFTEARGAPRATLRLRPDLQWHDGEPLTAGDVAFTYALLADTTLGSADDSDGEDSNTPIPAPRFRGRSDLVEGATALGRRTVEFRFVECTPRVATRAFTVPILPRHVWESRAGTASVGGIEFGPATEALVTDNVPAVGSGPLRFVRNTPRERLVLEPFDDHFLARDARGDLPRGVAGGPAFDRLSVQVVGSDATAVEIVASGEADVTGTPVGAATVPRIGRADEIDLLVRRSGAPYVIGYNARRPPLTNPRFRNTLARLVDQAHLADVVFEGYARPEASPLARTGWLPSDLRWNGANPVTPFLGADGELDVERARSAFREAGYLYDDGTLLEAD